MTTSSGSCVEVTQGTPRPTARRASCMVPACQIRLDCGPCAHLTRNHCEVCSSVVVVGLLLCFWVGVTSSGTSLSGKHIVWLRCQCWCFYTALCQRRVPPTVRGRLRGGFGPPHLPGHRVPPSGRRPRCPSQPGPCLLGVGSCFGRLVVRGDLGWAVCGCLFSPGDAGCCLWASGSAVGVVPKGSVCPNAPSRRPAPPLVRPPSWDHAGLVLCSSIVVSPNDTSV